MDDDDHQDVVVSTVTITRRYYPTRDNPDDRDDVNVDTSEGLTMLDTLGLLEFAKLSIAADMIRDNPEQ
jgi:hypothetical protein